MKKSESPVTKSLPLTGAREDRHCRLMTVEIERENGRSISAIVNNVSKHGMGGTTQNNLEPFEFIAVVKPGYGRVKGEVRWVDGDRFGVLFSEPINVELFNFVNANDKGYFVTQNETGHVWKGFDIEASPRRPGVTHQFSRS